MTRILSDEEFLLEINDKLDEELNEYRKDQNIEELADLLEVIYVATLAHGYTLDQLEEVRAKKAEERGTFEKKIFLEKVIGQKNLFLEAEFNDRG